MRNSLLLVQLLFSIAAIGQIPTNNLELYYPFSGNSNDQSGNGYNGSIYGATLTTDRFGNENSAYYFDGNNDYINTNNGFDFTERTISFWAQAESINGSGFGSCGAIWQDYNGYQNGVILADFRDGVLQLNGGSEKSLVDSTITAGKWIHIAISRASDSTKYYVNGKYVGISKSANLFSQTYTYPNLVIGTDRTRYRRYFKGKIDDVRVYSSALNESEIKSLYVEFDINDNLELNYSFNGNANDQSENGYDGLISGATLTTDRFGNENSAYYFDGNNDFINTNNGFDFTERTISFWAQPESIYGSGTGSCGAIWQDYNGYQNGVIMADFRDGVLQLNGGSEYSYVDSTVSTGNWIHIAISRASDSTKYYVNGNYVGISKSANLYSQSSPYPYLVIGTDRTRSRRFFKGKIDDIRVYSSSLTDIGIQCLYLEDSTISLSNSRNIGGSTIQANVLSTEISNTDIYLYPNPTTEFVTINSNNFEIMSYELYNISGTLLSKEDLTNNHLNVSKFPTGVYILKMFTETGIIYKRFEKE